MERVNIPVELLSGIELDRSCDDIYAATTGVVKVVMDMTRGVKQQGQPDQYVHLVMSIGTQLKVLLTAVDANISTLPTHNHHEVCNIIESVWNISEIDV